MTLKLDICSDLHVDADFHKTRLLNRPGEGPSHWTADTMGDPSQYFHFDFQWYRNPGSSVCIIAGDISDKFDDVVDVLEDASEFYDHVIFVDGNHEMRQDKNWTNGDAETTVSDTMCDLRIVLKGIPNVHYLNGIDDVSYRIDDTLFVGANGWYDWRCHEIRGITKLDAMIKWKTSYDSRLKFDEFSNPDTLGSIQFMNMASAVERANANPDIKNIVMVTHTCPDQQFAKWSPNLDFNKMTPSYVNTMSDLVLKADTQNKLKLWVFGHIHNRINVDVDGIRYINNSYGIKSDGLSTLWEMVSFEV